MLFPVAIVKVKFWEGDHTVFHNQVGFHLLKVNTIYICSPPEMTMETPKGRQPKI